MKQERKVQHTRAHQNISYRDALKITKDEDRTNKENRNDNQTKHKRVTTEGTSMITMREISTQTDSNNNVEKEKTKGRDVNSNENLAYCLLDLFISMLKADPITKKCTLISKAFSEHLGIIISKEDLLSSIKGTTSPGGSSSSSSRPAPSPIILSKSHHIRKNVLKS